MIKLQKLLDAGASTVAGSVLYYVPGRGQLEVATWLGGEECSLTPDGVQVFEDLLAPPQTEPEPRRRGRPRKEEVAEPDLGLKDLLDE